MNNSERREHNGIFGRVSHSGSAGAVSHAEVRLIRVRKAIPEERTAGGRGAQEVENQHDVEIQKVRTGSDGRFAFLRDYGDGAHIEDGDYIVRCVAFGQSRQREFPIERDSVTDVDLDLDLDLQISLHAYEGETREFVPVDRIMTRRSVLVRLEHPGLPIRFVRFSATPAASIVAETKYEAEIRFDSPGRARVEAVAKAVDDEAEAALYTEFDVTDPALAQALWVAIRNRTHAISFDRYRDFINRVLGREEDEKLPETPDKGAYEVLKIATEVFLLMECGVHRETDPHRHETGLDPKEEQTQPGEPVTMEQMSARLAALLGSHPQLPYIAREVEAAFPDYERAGSGCGRVITGRSHEPCMIELIWSYWHEECGLAQSMDAVAQRFQNIQMADGRDPLGNFEIDPLRPLNNLLWGFLQDEINRLAVTRRAYEYVHQYGLALSGKATPGIPLVEGRSKFLEAFHNLLLQSSVLFKEDDQTTVIADGFPLLDSLKETHRVLAQGAHNQFGDLPWTARVEMLIDEYILSLPAIREFLRSRTMAPYEEAWMPQVDAMKALQGWTDVAATHFRDLGVYGEQLLLSIRYGDWINVNGEVSARNWARYWRPEIQGYLRAYRAATGSALQ
jgi:hypothetical protein